MAPLGRPDHIYLLLRLVKLFKHAPVIITRVPEGVYNAFGRGIVYVVVTNMSISSTVYARAFE